MAAWRLGRLVAAGELDADQARAGPHQAAAACGLGRDDEQHQVTATIESGLRAGMQYACSPRQHKATRTRGRDPRSPAAAAREPQECAGQRDLGIVM